MEHKSQLLKNSNLSLASLCVCVCCRTMMKRERKRSSTFVCIYAFMTRSLQKQLIYGEKRKKYHKMKTKGESWFSPTCHWQEKGAAFVCEMHLWPEKQLGRNNFDLQIYHTCNNPFHTCFKLKKACTWVKRWTFSHQ